jgi:hypothetical protein
MTDAAAYPSCVHGRKVYERCTECEADMKAGKHGGFERASLASKQKMLKDLIELEKTAIAVGSVSLEASQLRALWNYIQRTGDETECAHCREVYEIYAGMEGFQPETAPEGYQCRIIEQMREAAEKGLHRQVCELHPHYYLPCPSCVDRKRRAQKTGREPAFDPDVRVLSSEEVARGLTLNNIATFAYPPWHRKRYCDSGLRLMGISDTRPPDWRCNYCDRLNDGAKNRHSCWKCSKPRPAVSEEARHE